MHWQTKLMGEYASVYGKEGGVVFVDGTHGITRHGAVFVFFAVVDCLMKSKIAGWTACWSEQADPIVQAAEAFFGTNEDDGAKIGEIEGYFDPFVDNVVKEGAVEVDEVEGNILQVVPSPPIISAVVLVSDEGPAFFILAEVKGWTHVLDRYHIAKKIEETWQGLDDPATYKEDMLNILDEPDLDVLTNTLFPAAKVKYANGSASKYVAKLFELQEKVCYAHVCKFFTAGHVSSQRVEGVNSSIKANGKLKLYLSDASYGEAAQRIMQVARESDRASIAELKTCRQSGLMVGLHFMKELKETAQLALRLSIVEPTEDPNKFQVKESEDSAKVATVEVDATVKWNNIEFKGCMICTCCFYTSTNRPCPCILRVCQHKQIDHQNPKIVHPRYWIAFHPLYNVALSELGLSDYDMAPWTSLFTVEMPKRAHESTGAAAQVNTSASVVSARTKVFDTLGDLGGTSTSQRVVLLRNATKALIDVAAETPAKTKTACAEMTELTNRLGAANLNCKTLHVRPTALSSTRDRYSRSMLQKSQSSQRWQAKKGPPTVAKTLKRKTARKVRHCSVCKKKGQPSHISSTHRSGSRCPYHVNPHLAAVRGVEDDEAPGAANGGGDGAEGVNQAGDEMEMEVGEDDEAGDDGDVPGPGDDDDDRDDDDIGGGGGGGGGDGGSGGDDGYDTDDSMEGDEFTDEHLVALKNFIDEARSNNVFCGVVAGPLALSVKARDGQDDLLGGFLSVMKDEIRRAVVVSTQEDLLKMHEVTQAFFDAHPNLNQFKTMIIMKKIETDDSMINTKGSELEEVNYFVDCADAGNPVEFIAYNAVIESLTQEAYGTFDDMEDD
eukprot:scaffold11088_cov129-Skeletonema_marinoi.AAC.2